MSEAMTNREIEDVLSSIRRLVAQDSVRAAPRPVDPVQPGSRLILTEAQRIDPPAAPVEPAAPQAAPGPDLDLPAPDFGRLEATIAELEAAVSASGGGWEGELVEEAPRASNVTDLYGRLAFTHRPAVEETAAPEASASLAGAGGVAPADAQAMAEPAEAAPARSGGEGTPEAAAPRRADAGALDAGAPYESAPYESAPDARAPDASELDEITLDESGEDEIGEDEAVLDEAALRALIAQIVREELHGQLGERITAQVRKLVRAEIAKALDERRML